MKLQINFEGDFHEDREDISTILNCYNMAYAISEAQELIRSRLKYNDTIDADQIKFLEEVRESLIIRGME